MISLFIRLEDIFIFFLRHWLIQSQLIKSLVRIASKIEHNQTKP